MSLFCVISLTILPPVLVKWMFEGGSSKPVVKKSKNETRDVAKSELITFLDVEGQKQNNGTYTCKFSNKFGELSAAMDVSVTC